MAEDQNIERSNLADSLLSGVRSNGKQAKGMREAASDLFKPSAIVVIKNPFDHETGWVYVNPEEETVTQPDTATRRVTYGDPTARVLQVGESVTIPGWEAYIALDRMYKEWGQERPEGLSATLGSADLQEEFLGKAFGGVVDLSTLGGTTRTAPAAAEDAAEGDPVEDSLGFAEEGAPKPQRTRTI